MAEIMRAFMRRAGFQELLLMLGCSMGLLYGRRTFTHDTWWHLVMGEDIARLGAIPPELYSYTARGADLHFHSWLCDILFSMVEAWGGLNLLELAGALLCGLAAWLVVQNARILGARGAWPLAAGVAFLLCGRTLLILRPQIVSLVLLGWLLRELQLYLRGKLRSGFALLPIFALWSNLHGVYVFGLLVVAAFAVFSIVLPADTAERWRGGRLLGWFSLAVLASGLNPLGYSQLLSIFEHDPFVLGASAHINEWLPPPLSRTPEFYAVVFFGLLATLRARPRLERMELALFVLSLCMALTSWRHVVIFGVFGLPVLAVWCSRAWHTDKPREEQNSKLAPDLVTTAAISILTIVAAWQLLLREPALESPAISRGYPVSAARWIALNKPAGNMFNTYEWGGYLIYSLRERLPVYIDSRLVPYRDIFATEYFTIFNLRLGWEEVLQRRGIASMLLPAQHSQLSKLTEEYGWQLLYKDETAVVVASRR